MEPDRDELLVHAKRLLSLIDGNTTELADELLRVPIENYGSPERWQREVDVVFRGSPVPVALSVELAERGSYKTFDVCGLPILVWRGNDGTARAFFNVCRHRGAPVIEQPCGVANRVSCPYHAWTYNADGSLARVSSEPLFGDVDHDTHGLTALPCEERYGVVFAVLTPGASIDLDAWLGPFEPELERLRLGERHLAWTNQLAGPNWKVCADGYTENYHFPFLHPDTIAAGNLGNVMAHDSWRQFQRILMPRRSIVELRDGAAASLSPADIARHWSTVHYVFPNTMLSSSWGEWTFVSQVWPGRNVGESTTTQLLLSTEPIDTEDRKASAARQRETYHAVIDGDDYRVGRAIQRGLASGANTHFTFGRNEIGTQHLHRWVDRLLAEKG